MQLNPSLISQVSAEVVWPRVVASSHRRLVHHRAQSLRVARGRRARGRQRPFNAARRRARQAKRQITFKGAREARDRRERCQILGGGAPTPDGTVRRADAAAMAGAA